MLARFSTMVRTAVAATAVSAFLIWPGTVRLVRADELPEMINKAKDAFTARTEADVKAAKAELIAAIARLDARLTPTDPQAGRWRAYLAWDPLKEQLARPEGPDLPELDKIYAKYVAGYEGLDLAEFKEVCTALRNYLTTARAVGDTTLESQYQEMLLTLPKHLEAYQQKPTVEEAAALSSVVQWLDEAGQAPWLATAIRKAYTRPNVFARIDANVVVAGIAEPIDEIEPVTDVILGASVRGTGHNVGQVTAQLVPSETQARVDSVYCGTITSNTASYKGPARVSSYGVTRVETHKPILLGADGFSTLPATSTATTRSTIRNVSVNRGRFAQRAASNQAYSQKGQGERISAQHAESRANCRADERAAETIADSQERYARKFRDPLRKRDLFPQQFNFSTTNEAVHLIGLQVGPYDLGAPNDPPPISGRPHLAAQVHESMVNNLAEEALSGMVLTEERFQKSLENFFDEVPERFKPDPDRPPFTITFAASQPITVSFRDGEIRITIRGERYMSGDSGYPGMDVTAVYKIARGDKGLTAVRQGELQIFPPGFDPKGEGRLSVREQTLRTLLERRFGKIFEPEIVPDPVELSGKWEKTGQYGLDQWETADGWMVTAWNRLPAGQAPQKAEAEATAN